MLNINIQLLHNHTQISHSPDSDFKTCARIHTYSEIMNLLNLLHQPSASLNNQVEF